MKNTRTWLATRIRIGCLSVLIGILLLSGSPKAQVTHFLLRTDTDAESGDKFGSVMTRGDFNGDHYEDLVVGLPYEDISAGYTSIPDAGAVEVIYGSLSGLTSVNRQFLRQGLNAVKDVPEAADYFGCSLAAADFNDDGFDDLAIGVCGEDVGTIVDAGAVNVIYGSPQGVSATFFPDQFWHQSLDYCPVRVGGRGYLGSWLWRPCVLEDMVEAGDGFGWSLATWDRGGVDVLVIGIPFEDVGTITDAGAITVLKGSNQSYRPGEGLHQSSIYPTFWNQDSIGIPDVAEANDRFAYSLAVGDFDRDGEADVAVGVPWEDVGTVPDAGAVSVISGSALRGAYCNGQQNCPQQNQFWQQNVASPFDVEPGDRFGWSLAVGNFTGWSFDDFDDLAIGVPFEDIGSIPDAGAVNVLYGSAAGLSSAGIQFWHQDSPDVEDNAEAYDYFGYSLAAGDFDRVEGFDDLAIGVPFEDIGSVVDAGAVNVIYGAPGGLNAYFYNTPDQFWHQNISNVEDVAEAGDNFGFSLMTCDIQGPGYGNLAVGIPHEDLSGLADAGAVGFIYGSYLNSLFGGLNATSTPDQFWTQTLPAVLMPINMQVAP